MSKPAAPVTSRSTATRPPRDLDGAADPIGLGAPRTRPGGPGRWRGRRRLGGLLAGLVVDGDLGGGAAVGVVGQHDGQLGDAVVAARPCRPAQYQAVEMASGDRGGWVSAGRRSRRGPSARRHRGATASSAALRSRATSHRRRRQPPGTSTRDEREPRRGVEAAVSSTAGVGLAGHRRAPRRLSAIARRRVADRPAAVEPGGRCPSPGPDAAPGRQSEDERRRRCARWLMRRVVGEGARRRCGWRRTGWPSRRPVRRGERRAVDADLPARVGRAGDQQVAGGGHRYRWRRRRRRLLQRGLGLAEVVAGASRRVRSPARPGSTDAAARPTPGCGRR